MAWSKLGAPVPPILFTKMKSCKLRCPLHPDHCRQGTVSVCGDASCSQPIHHDGGLATGTRIAVPMGMHPQVRVAHLSLPALSPSTTGADLILVMFCF